jgi:hypothetical protein
VKLVASKFAWLVGKQAVLVAVLAVLAAFVGGLTGHHTGYGFWDGPK